MDQEIDKQTVELFLRNRDEYSFREIYRRHSPALFGMACRLCRTDSDAEDVLQETWIRACRILPSFEWRSSFRTWLTGILVNCVREQSRKSGRLESAEIDGVEIAAASESETLTLEQAIQRLPDGYRHVLVLHDVEGRTHEEIAHLLNISTGTSKSQLHHARKTVRTLYFAEK